MTELIKVIMQNILMITSMDFLSGMRQHLDTMGFLATSSISLL